MNFRTPKTSTVVQMKRMVVVVAVLVSVSVASVPRCPEGHYLNGDTQSCLPCATCPRNQIIRVPCSEHFNTVCGPFFEFYEFHQAPRPTLDIDNLHLLEEDDRGGWMGGRGKWSFDSGLDHDDEPPDDLSEFGEGEHHSNPSQRSGERGNDVDNAEDWPADPSFGQPPTAEDPDKGPHQSVHSAHPPHEQSLNLQNLDDEECPWKVLALALIIVLCVVCVFLIIVIFILCYLRSRRVREKQTILSSAYDPSTRSAPYRSSVPRYIPIPHASILAPSAAVDSRETSAERVTTSAVPMVDSSDSGVAGHSYDQITPTSDYVYFKSPQNGNHAVDV